MLEFQLTSDSIGSIPLWLSVLLGISTILTLISLLQVAGTRFELAPPYDRICKALLAFLAALQIFIWQLYFYCDEHDTVSLWCFATSLCAGVLLWRFGTSAPAVGKQPLRGLTYVFVAVSVIQLAGFAQAMKHFSELVPQLDAPEPGQLLDKQHVAGRTDNGRAVRLAARSLTSDEYKKYIFKCQKAVAAMSTKAMLREPPQLQSNCHGWVFTGGEHLLRGEDVQLILDDNGYNRVHSPESNDIAIYRDQTGFITHTGLVRGTLSGAVMVESKWGIGAVYLHVAEEQPYGKNLEYYRTRRGSHHIKTVSTDTAPDSSLASSTAPGRLPQAIRY